MKRLLSFLVLSIGTTLPVASQTRLLDDFEDLSGWTSIVSDGARLNIAPASGKDGTGMMMEFDLSKVAGYVIAEKEFTFDLPDNYQFTFDMRAEAPVNNFEFKILDENDNVHWIKKLNVTYPGSWTRQRIKKRHLSFAWGPAPGKPLRSVRRLQFVVSAGTGGTGRVYVDNFRFEPIDDNAAARATVRLTGRSTTIVGADSLTIDFGYRREIGGVVIDWEPARAVLTYELLLSDDGEEWQQVYSVEKGSGGRRYIPLPESEGNFLKLLLHAVDNEDSVRIAALEVKGPEFAATANAFFHAIAAESPQGWFPKYFLDQQSYWTVVGTDGDTKEALINEQGQIEVDRLQFSLEPFLYADGRLITWKDVKTAPSLYSGYLPIPSVTWDDGGRLTLTVQAVASGVAGNSQLAIRYAIRAHKPVADARLFVAIRPFQVNPSSQFLNTIGGVSRVDSVRYRNRVVTVNGIPVVSLPPPSDFGACRFDQGEIIEHISKNTLPGLWQIDDPLGYASAALRYDLRLGAGQTKDVVILVPFHQRAENAVMPGRVGDPAALYDSLLTKTADSWQTKLSRARFHLPSPAKAIENTVKSTLAYILINRDGPGIQPGSRSYERSWIRDGSLTCAALLRTGHLDEVREFVDWYARGQFPNGKIPCVIDGRGPDAVPEHDSNGEFIYAVRQYFLFSKDTAWLRQKFDAVVKTVRYIQSLRAQRKTNEYRTGTPQQRALYGLVPESISHEGYSDVPRHSYWDDFFVLRGLKDAAAIAAALGERDLDTEFAAERDDFRRDLYASMQRAMKNRGIDYIPGCAELGDFDATSTTIGLSPVGELGSIPEPALHNTFEKYYSFFTQRMTDTSFINYTPYETRVIGSFVILGQKARAEEALWFFMNDRRPPAWNHWAEVVWRDPASLKFIGDMPHTWVGSDFVRSVLTMFVLERERDDAHILCAGIPDSWVLDPEGVGVEKLRTYYGAISYTLRSNGKKVVAKVSGDFDALHHRLILASPLQQNLHSVKINGKNVGVPNDNEIALPRLPATVEMIYR